MVECVAKRDGLLPGARYVNAGETFVAESCPKWAEVVKELPAEPEATAKKKGK